VFLEWFGRSTWFMNFYHQFIIYDITCSDFSDRFIDNFLLVNLEMDSHGRDVIEQSWLSDLFYWLAKKAIKE
jgi:hypothetical protein